MWFCWAKSGSFDGNGYRKIVACVLQQGMRSDQVFWWAKGAYGC
jgi:hypothetical protein